MKKLILFFAIFFISCSDQNSAYDDDNTSTLYDSWRKEHINLKRDKKLKIHKKYCAKGLDDACAEAINDEIKIVKTDEEKLEIYDKYCEHGVSYGCHEAGWLLVETNPSQKALEFLQKACEIGNSQSCEDLAKAYDANGDNSLFERALNLPYEPSKVSFYLKKMCDKGGECERYYKFCNGEKTYLWVDDKDVNAVINIDEAVRLDIESYDVCGDVCNKEAGLWYARGAYGNDGFRRTGVGQDLSKASVYFDKIKGFEQSVFHEIYEALKKAENTQLIEAKIKEFCDKGDKTACEFYDERYKK